MTCHPLPHTRTPPPQLRNIKRELDELRHVSNLQALSHAAQGEGGTAATPIDVGEPLETPGGGSWSELPEPPTPQLAPPSVQPAPPTPQPQGPAAGELVRLQEEKEALLRSGQYAADDPVIEQITSKIKLKESEAFG